MKRIVLFRFHENSSVCRNRIQLLRLFNPDVRIFGLYGGDEGNFYKFRNKLGKELDHIYCVTGVSDEWKWKNSDLAVRRWFMDYGKQLSFDMLHVIEWDMLFFNSISEIYKHIPEDGIGLSGLILLKEIEHVWSWTSREPFRSEWNKLLSYARGTFNYMAEPYACIAGGACLSKEFLKEYARTDIPELCNDELRLPLFAQILGINIYDTGLYKWYDKNEEDFFNVEVREIKSATIKNELRRPSGRRIFHPYRKIFCHLIDCNRWYNAYRKTRDIAGKLSVFLGK